MSSVPTITLNNGVEIPQIGLGVWQASDEDTERAVRYAIEEAGYRHIDGAKIYGNEEGLGRAIMRASVPREELFITTKLWNADHGREATLAAIDGSLQRLGLDHVDLYLIHWPLDDGPQLTETWLAMEEILEAGKARAIGVSNHEPKHLDAILRDGSIVPAVNQIELHPRFPQRELREFDAAHGIATEAWSPLGGTSGSGWGPASKPNTLLGDPVIAEIGERHGKSPAQVLVRWHVQNGVIVIPKSTHEERIKANIDVLDFELTAEDLAAIAGLETGERVGAHPDEVGAARPDAD